MNAPSYLGLLRSGELARRVDALDELLGDCTVCPWNCHVDRRAGETKVCVAAYLPIVASFAPHFGEEPALSGTLLPRGEAKGAGNIFLGHCNLRCVYCQNGQISQDFSEFRSARKAASEGTATLRRPPDVGETDAPPRPYANRPSAAPELGEVPFERLAQIMLELQRRDCHNIGFVSPTHFAPQIARAVMIAAEAGLSLPLVYNTNAYDSMHVLRLLEGVFDIYLPDLKYGADDTAREYSKIPDYVRHARAAIREMHRQVGDTLEVDERGLLRRGLVIRLLVLPNDVAGLRESLEWIAGEIGTKVTLSVMSQYYPTHRVGGERYPLLDRRLREREFDQVLGWLDELGFENGWIQPFDDDAATYYRPDFEDRQVPFPDARDFER